MTDGVAWRYNLELQPMSGPVTECLAQWRAGSPGAIDRLVPLVYAELRALARAHLVRESAQTLSATSLVHEVYLRLLRQQQLTAGDRDGFLRVAGVTMRRILVDHARARRRLKRGGPGTAESLDDFEVPLLTPLELDEVIALDDALDALAVRDARARSVVECRIFGGLTIEETATALDISPRSVRRSWDTAIAWLRATIAPAHLPSDEAHDGAELG